MVSSPSGGFVAWGAHTAPVSIRSPLVAFVLAAGLVVALSPLAWWDEADGAGYTILLLWQAAPFALLAYFVDQRWLSAPAAVVGVLVLAAATVANQILTARDDSSTGSLTLLWIPFWLMAVPPLVQVGQWLVRTTASRIRNRA